MAYLFKSISLTNIDKSGTALSPTLSFLPSTIPAEVAQFAMGNRVRMEIIVEATGTDNFTDKIVRINLGAFLGTTGFNNNFGFQSYGPITAVATNGEATFGNDGVQLTRENISSVFQLVAGEAVCTIDFYMTCDIGDYPNTSFSISNQGRFLLARYNFTAILRNVLKTVYSELKILGVCGKIFNWTGTDIAIVAPVTSAPFLAIPFTARWYNSDFYGDTTDQRYISELEITSPTQIAAGLPSLTFMQSAAAQTGTLSTDSAFTVTSNQLAYNEKNTVTVTLNGFSDPSLTVTTVDNIRALLIQSDNFTSGSTFPDAYDLSEAIIPALDVSTTQLDNAIYTPSSWTQDGGTGEIVLEFDIDGAELSPGRSYRLIINIYEDANPDRPTTHISPEMVVSYAPPIIPDIDSFIGSYAQEYNVTELQDVAPHQRIRCRVDIDKVNYNAALAALGFPTDSFDNSLFEVYATLLEIPSVIGQTQEYFAPNTAVPPLNNAILTSGMQIVTDDANTLSLAATFRIEAERAISTATVRWTIRFRQPSFVQQDYINYDIQYDQLLGVRFFENDNGIPYLVNARFLDADLYPASKVDIIDICDRDTIICEIERDSALLSGSVSFLACIYPVDGSGNTTNPQIEEEESWAPAVPIMAQLNSGKLDSVESGFGSDDFVAFRINVQQLIIGQRYSITGIAIQQVPDYCPIGLTELTLITTIRPATIVGWTVAGNATDFITEITGHPDYVGGVTVIYNRIVDGVGTLVGSQMISGYIASAQAIDPINNEVYYQLRVDAIFDTGSGPHLISHTLEVTIPRPPLNTPPLNYDSNAYICNDLG